MCAKVKAEVQNIAGELVVSGLDSATSLIQVKYHATIMILVKKIPGQNNELSLIKFILGCQKSYECCCINSQIILCCLNEIQKSTNSK